MEKEYIEALKKCIKEKLELNNIKYKNDSNSNEIKIDFENENISTILDKYIKLKKKYFIVNKKFEVVYSNELKRKLWMLTKNNMMIINDIKEKIETNKSIKPYLSNNLYLNKFSKDDEMLFNNNIYHLHLGSIDKKEHFVTRTSKLLFFTYNENEVIFLDVKKHPIGDGWNKLFSSDVIDKYISRNADDLIFKNKEIILNEIENLNELDDNKINEII